MLCVSAAFLGLVLGRRDFQGGNGEVRSSPQSGTRLRRSLIYKGLREQDEPVKGLEGSGSEDGNSRTRRENDRGTVDKRAVII